MKIEFVDKNRLIPKGRGKERQRVRGRERIVVKGVRLGGQVVGEASRLLRGRWTSIRETS